MWALKIAATMCVAKSRFSSDFTSDDVKRVHPVAAYREVRYGMDSIMKCVMLSDFIPIYVC